MFAKTPQPHTSVQDFRKCHSLIHLERFGPNHHYCDNCVRKHHSRECVEPPMCVNSKNHNKDHNLNFYIHNKVSDPRCEKFRATYRTEMGFLMSSSQEIMLIDILISCILSIASGKYTSLVSLDIKGAFNNVGWRDIYYN